MNRVAIFSISSDNYANRASICLNSFARNYDHSIDTYNILTKDVLNKTYANQYIQDAVARYGGHKTDILRWCLKPSLILYFLLDLGYDKCLYVDNDIYCVNNNTAIIDSIKNGILLTKHHRPLLPDSINQHKTIQFVCNFTDGFFNAGFIAANKKAQEALFWWHNVILWKCEKNKLLGLFDDQKYLDILALHFDSVIDICKHPGCNLALWNTRTIPRHFDSGWRVQQNFDPIFCHFSGINENNYSSYKNYDPMLISYYEKYLAESQCA